MRSPLLLLLLVTAPGFAMAELAWHATPEIATADARGNGASHRGPRPFYLRDGEGAEASLHTPDLQVRPLPVAQARAELRPTGKEGYHLLLARRELPGEIQAAFRYVYLPGKPSGHSPSELLQGSVTRLEIVPTPLPREHWRYESSEGAAFQVRLDGAPLAHVPVHMTTSNGTLLEAKTDGHGAVRFVLPEDFARVGAGRKANAPADFVVAVSHRAGDTGLRTTLNADYYVNPSHWHSTFGAVAVLATGFLVGLFVVRPREETQA